MRSRLPRKSKVASAALWCSPSPNTTRSHYKAFRVSSLAQKPRQLRHVGRDAALHHRADRLQSAILCCVSHRAYTRKGNLPTVLLGLEVAMSNIKKRARGTTTWLNRAGSGNDLTTLSDRDLRDLGLVRQQIGINTCKLFWLV